MIFFFIQIMFLILQIKYDFIVVRTMYFNMILKVKFSFSFQVFIPLTIMFSFL